MKNELHPRNRHRDRYDFPTLIKISPKLANFVAENAYGDESIDFANPEAVKALNQAILLKDYHVKAWDVPPGYLCPPIPGRADYLHHVADILALGDRDAIPKGRQVRVLDIGTGANCIYPLIGQAEYGWSFVGTDIDPLALDAATQVLIANPQARDCIELRLQPNPQCIFENVVNDDDTFDLTICNPPFHASQQEAQESSRRKWKNLGKNMRGKSEAPILNFGGTGHELWCDGGERTFILHMIRESAKIAKQCQWFTTLVSKELFLPVYASALDSAGAKQDFVVDMAQGQKRSRILAWSYR